MASSQQTAAETISLLEERLNRVNYILYGNTDFVEQPMISKENASASTRLRSLESRLHSLASRSAAVSDILALQKKHPSAFDPAHADAASTLPTASLASLVLAHSQLYISSSTRLSQLQDLSIPDPASAAKLIALRPRIEAANAKQTAQAKEFSELRARSAKAVESWYESGVLGMGEQWAEWEERLRDAEILVRRREAARRREDGML